MLQTTRVARLGPANNGQSGRDQFPPSHSCLTSQQHIVERDCAHLADAKAHGFGT